MVKYTLLIILLILTSCGARKKTTNKSIEESKIETSNISKVDSKKLNDIIIDKKIIKDTKELQFSVTPLIVDSVNGNTNSEIIIETADGKQTKIKYPKNSSVNFGTKDSKEDQTENKKDKSKEEVKSDNQNTSKSDNKKKVKNSDLQRDEPKVFNRTFAIVLGIIILLLIVFSFIYFKIIKHNTKPL